jgi:hypothetical protein
MALALLLLVNAVVTSPKPSALGLVVTAVGGIVYATMYRPRVKPT